MKNLLLLSLLLSPSAFGLNVKRSASDGRITLPLSKREVGSELVSSNLEFMMNSATASAARFVEREYDLEETDASESLERRGAGTTWPWYVSSFPDKAGFAFNMFTTLTTNDDTNGGGAQSYYMMVDSGSSDTWMTTPYNPAKWPLGDSNSYSISYGWGSISGVKIYSVPSVTVGSASITNFKVGYLPSPPAFLSTLATSSVGGIFGLGASTLAGTNTSWNGWCNTHAYVIYIASSQLSLCTSTSGGNQFSFYSGTNRAAFTATTAKINVGSSSFAITPQPMLLDTGSAYIVVDNVLALQINTYLKTLYPVTLKRRDGETVPDNSTFYEPPEEVKSKVMNLIRRQSPTVYSGPYPSHVSTLTTTFYRIACGSGGISINLNGVTYYITTQQYVFRDSATNYCYSAIVGVTALLNTASNEIGTFSILGLPFIRSSSITAISVNHDTRTINIV
jgi:hypothetical protein